MQKLISFSSRLRWVMLPLVTLIAVLLRLGAGQPTAEEFIYPQTTLGGPYDYSLEMTLLWDAIETSDSVYYRVVYDSKGVLETVPGTDAMGNFTARDELGNLVTSLSLNQLQPPGTGHNTMQVQMSYEPSFDNYTSGEYVTWSIPAFISVLPPIVTLVLAVITQDVLISLFTGVYVAAFLTRAYNPIVAWLRTLDYFLIESFLDSGHQQVILFSWFLSGMVAVVSKSGGAHGMAESISKFAKTRLSGGLLTMAVCFILFMDDYSNCLISGNTMRPITDGLYISREKLAFVVDSTAAPVASVVPVSAWVGFEVSQIALGIELTQKMGYDMEAMGYETNAFSLFLQTIPQRYYPLYMVFLVFLTLALKRDFGPMLKAERRAMYQHKVYADTAKLEECEVDSVTDPDPDTPRKWWNGILAIALLVILVILGIFFTGYFGTKAAEEDLNFQNILANCDSYLSLLYATATASVFQFILVGLQGKKDGKLCRPRFLGGPKGAKCLLNLPDSIRYFLEGLKTLMSAVLTLILAWAIGLAISEVGAAQFISRALSSTIPSGLLPVLTFLLSAVISLATGTSWGTMSIMFPIVIPTSVQSAPGDQELLVCASAAILAGAVFGDHCTPISDTTILSSMACRCDLRHHVLTQLPYALVAGGFAAVVGYLLVGLKVLPPWAAILIGWACVLAFVVLVCSRVDGNGGEASSDHDDGLMGKLTGMFGRKKDKGGAVMLADDDDFADSTSHFGSDAGSDKDDQTHRAVK